jgi:hypothetical protein
MSCRKGTCCHTTVQLYGHKPRHAHNVHNCTTYIQKIRSSYTGTFPALSTPVLCNKTNKNRATLNFEYIIYKKSVKTIKSSCPVTRTWYISLCVVYVHGF